MNTGIDDPQEKGCQLEKAEDRPTLLSYLHPADGRFALRVSLKEDPHAAIEGSHYPFLVMTDRDPLFRLIEAKIVTDGGSEVRRVFLMLQKDEYVLSRDDLWPITNRDIDEAWQKAFSFYSREGRGPSAHVLVQQVNRSGRFIPFQSLFFCKARGIFFHPPCPRCGAPLEMCYDGPLLARSGLQPYSTSLRRYLFCHTCAQKGSPDFYVFGIQSSDPAPVKDRLQLIKGFGPLAAGELRTGQFPCFECVHQQDCYGPDQKALLRVIPFSFYPFYLLVLEGMTLHAIDFLALASGAPFEELELQLKAGGEFGRARCLEAMHRRGLEKMPFFFGQNEAFFLEVLYLKLSFLGQLIQSLGMDRTTSLHPVLKPSIDSVWVKIPEPDGLLPFFWNFRAIPFDLSRDLKDVSSFPVFPDSPDERFLGLLWLYAFLANRKQDLPAVYSALGRILGRVSSDGNPSFEAVFGGGGEGVFRPENIFWNPDGREVAKRWKPLWERAIILGGVLLGGGRREGAAFSREEWWKEWESLRATVKESLFHRETGEKREEQRQASSPGRLCHKFVHGSRNSPRTDEGASPINDWAVRPEPVEGEAANLDTASGEESGTGEDGIIHGILAGILKKWEKGQKPASPEPAETVILNVKKLEESGQRESREEMAETVILSAGHVRGGLETARGKEEGVAATGGQTPVLKVRQEVPQEDVMAETVILKPRKEMARNAADETGRVPGTAKAKPQPEEEFMAETVILGPVQRQKKKGDGSKE